MYEVLDKAVLYLLVAEYVYLRLPRFKDKHIFADQI